MSNLSFDVLWREGMMELLDLLEFETPEDAALSPKDLTEWAAIYVKYLQTLRKLEQVYHLMVHPQKRLDVKDALEMCMGRMLEVRHWLVDLNGGGDIVDLHNVLLDLKLTPDALDVPIPRYFVEDRAQELLDRSKFLAALVDKYKAGGNETSQAPLDLGPMTEDEALALIQATERGRQAVQRVRLLALSQRQSQLDSKKAELGHGWSPDTAAIRIQAAARGLIWRRNVRRAAEKELEFIGMTPKVVEASKEPQTLFERICGRRKGVQANFRGEYQDMIVTQKARVKEMEALDMRETIQDKIHAWALENRDPETGTLPDIPTEEEGGSKLILNPPAAPPPPPPEPDPKAKKAAAKPAPKPKAKGKEEAPPPPPKVAPTAFVGEVERTVRTYVETWQERDESGNFMQRPETDLVRTKVRPLVFDEVRVAVDEEMRVLLANIRAMVEAEKAAMSGKKAKAAKAKKPKKKSAKEGGEGKKKKDPTADRSVESLYAELVSNGIVQPCEGAAMSDYLGSCSFRGPPSGAKQGFVEPSMAQLRQAVTEFCALPLGSSVVRARAPTARSVLLYGPPGSGKTLLSRGVASQTGATWFDLSPQNINGKYPGKAVGLLLHMVFKVAHLMAPSVIYIDQVEQVFVTDKRKAAEFGYTLPPSRIKKDLLKEVEGLKPEDRVLILGNSSQPQSCIKKDETALLGFFDKLLSVPMADHASRRAIWGGLLTQRIGSPPDEVHLSTLAHTSEGYMPGAIVQVVERVVTGRRVARLHEQPLAPEELLTWLGHAARPDPAYLQSLREWGAQAHETMRTKGQEPQGQENDKANGKDGGEKKKKKKKA